MKLALPLVLALGASPKVAGRWSVEQMSAGPIQGTSRRVLTYVPAACTRPRTRGPPEERPSAGRLGSGERLCPLVLCLHGWAGRPEDFREKTEIAALADRHGLVLALPEMGKSVYESAFYAQTRSSWGEVPGARWIGEIVLPRMRERLPVLPDRAHTAVLGYSTGGRGAIVVSERYPEFAAAASLSGTYDLSLLDPAMGEYAIHAKVFGPRDAFGARWASEDCVSGPKLEALQPVWLFIGHGEKDGTVPASQARAFERALREARHPGFEVNIEPDAGHDFAYWNRALPRAFEAIARRVASSGP